MIFKQIQEIIAGTKTQTRRIVKPGESLWTDYLTPRGGYAPAVVAQRLKWQVGRDYAVSPGRGKPGVFVNFHHPCYGYDIWQGTDPVSTDKGLIDWREFAPRQGYEPLRIVITAIRQEPLQDISPEDVRAEGIWCDVDHDPLDIGFSRDLHNQGVYRQLWNDINTRKDTRWEDNPQVWVIEFEKRE